MQNRNENIQNLIKSYNNKHITYTKVVWTEWEEPNNSA